ncbi:MAG: hypothetical protein ACYTDW_03375 [Planctomycetota bacterium]|jgi:hypothetical protein
MKSTIESPDETLTDYSIFRKLERHVDLKAKPDPAEDERRVDIGLSDT